MMIPPSPTTLISAANAFIGWDEDAADPVSGRLAQRSAFVECLLREVHANVNGEAPVPWHTAFIHHAGYWSHYDHIYGASSWPLPATASPNELAAFAAERGVLRDEPEDGDIFLLWAPVKQQFVRAGIVIDARDFGKSFHGSAYQECVTIEANTDEGCSADGHLVLRRVRRLSAELGDRFIRWADLDVRAERMAGFIRRGGERSVENARAEAEARAAGLLEQAMPLYPFSPIR